MESKSLEHALVEIQAAVFSHVLFSASEAAELRGCTVADLLRFVIEDRTLRALHVNARGDSKPFVLGGMRSLREPVVDDLGALTDPYTGKSVGHLRFEHDEVVRHRAECVEAAQCRAKWAEIIRREDELAHGQATSVSEPETVEQHPAALVMSDPEPISWADVLKKEVLIATFKHEWPSINKDLGEASRNDLKEAAHTGRQSYWYKDKAHAWALSKGKIKPDEPVHHLDSAWSGVTARNTISR